MNKRTFPTDYDLAYDRTRRFVARFSLPAFHRALRRLTPAAQSETDWGVIDALADLVQERSGPPPA